jgi:hypothetical protein
LRRSVDERIESMRAAIATAPRAARSGRQDAELKCPGSGKPKADGGKGPAHEQSRARMPGFVSKQMIAIRRNGKAELRFRSCRSARTRC